MSWKDKQGEWKKLLDFKHKVQSQSAYLSHPPMFRMITINKPKKNKNELSQDELIKKQNEIKLLQYELDCCIKNLEQIKIEHDRHYEEHIQKQKKIEENLYSRSMSKKMRDKIRRDLKVEINCIEQTLYEHDRIQKLFRSEILRIKSDIENTRDSLGIDF